MMQQARHKKFRALETERVCMQVTLKHFEKLIYDRSLDCKSKLALASSIVLRSSKLVQYM